jgi:hypothetical protein
MLLRPFITLSTVPKSQSKADLDDDKKAPTAAKNRINSSMCESMLAVMPEAGLSVA